MRDEGDRAGGFRNVMSQLDTFDRILASLHAAMLDDAHWDATSLLIDEACGALGNGLVVGDGRSEPGGIFYANFCYRGQRDRDRERHYFDLYYPHDERVPRLRRLADSRLVRIAELYTEPELKTSATYNWALPQAGYQRGLNVRLDGPDGSSIVWTLADPTERGGWGSDQIEMIERLLPHIRDYVRVRQALVGAEALGASLSGLLDTTRIGAIHLDRRGRIVEANDRARRLLRKGDGLADPGGFLGAWLPPDNARLQRLLARALPRLGGEAAVSGSMTVQRSLGLPRLAVHVSPVAVRQTDFGGGRIAAVVLVVDPASRPRIDAGLVAEALGLTPAESQVAVLLAAGSSVRDIAAATGRTEGSTYWYVGQLHRKLGTSRQADLVRLVLSLAELSGPRR